MARVNLLQNPSLRWFFLGAAAVALVISLALVYGQSPDVLAAEFKPADDPANLIINEKPSYGTVVKGSGEIKITSANTNKASSVYYAKKVDIRRFNTTFSYEDDPFVGGSLASGKPGKMPSLSLPEGSAPWTGFTFVIQNAGPNAVGDAGFNLGYAPKVTKSVAVFFGQIDNGDLTESGIGLLTNGASPDGGNPTSQDGIDLRTRGP